MNFLSDRKRDRSSNEIAPRQQNWDSGGARREFDGREFNRHSRNFGGSDFQNVRNKMKDCKVGKTRNTCGTAGTC